VLEIWEDGPCLPGDPLIDLGTLFTSVADLFHHLFEMGSFSNTHIRHCFSKKMFFCFFTCFRKPYPNLLGTKRLGCCYCSFLL
jgi:hypothetical protein